ncbi:MAG: transcription-repair coupling factor [Deltaproteobacteria bacterium]
MPALSTTQELCSAFERAAAVEQASPVRWTIGGLAGGSDVYLMARLAGLALDGTAPVAARPLLLLAADGVRAEGLAGELCTLLGENPRSGFLDRRVHLFPAREAPPLEMVSAAPEVESGRMAALYQLAAAKVPLIVTSPEAVLQRTPAPASLLASLAYVVVGEESDRDQLAARLAELGYRATGLVEEPGDYAVRGGIIDVYPPGNELPQRIELLGDVVESIRVFDPVDQRSVAQVEEAVLLAPAAVRTDAFTEPGPRRAVLERADELSLPTREAAELDRALADGLAIPGLELLLPYTGAAQAWLGDYLGPSGLVVLCDPDAVAGAARDFHERLAEGRAAAEDAGSFHPPAGALYLDPAVLRSFIDSRSGLDLRRERIPEGDAGKGGTINLEVGANGAVTEARARMKAARARAGFAPMARVLGEHRTRSRTVVVASDATQAARLVHLVESAEEDRRGGAGGARPARLFPGLSAALAAEGDCLRIIEGRLAEGFHMDADGLALISDEEIFGRKRHGAGHRRRGRGRSAGGLGDLVEGEAVVHIDHGIGLYRGLTHLRAGGTEGDFIHIEYAGGDRYYLPVDRINLVERHVGAGAGLKLAKLGGTAWARSKNKARETILALASELLEVEAYRSASTRTAFAVDDTEFEDFEAQFEFEETKGQSGAIVQVVTDMTADKPMDRLVCGDVGYGKTEVAMRAAFLAAMGGKQTAVLVPTTVLARQHHESFKSRMEGYPIEVGMLSRLGTPAANREVVAGLREGKIDIVIGTHRLLQSDVVFGRLGLLIVDEEHRFGVKAKERIKRMRREVDVLTLTATPIPRTLQMALGGVRDLSLIETAPIDRLAIRTYVARYDEGLIKQALERELARSGQAFFVHNRVVSIDEACRAVSTLVPKARTAIAHGQMRESELDRVMLDFLEQRVDVLVTTSIIESGLDIPNANTIVVNRADTFGLAQLYQIRGRVGRSFRRAYAYLLVPGEHLVTEDARKRLEILSSLDDLGSGFKIAAHDMEIRGAGNLLGKEQSGQVEAVGFELFMSMLEEEVAALRGQPRSPQVEPEVEVGGEAFIPSEYIEDVGERLLVYRRLANAENADAVADITHELVDRFGMPPPPVAAYARVMSLRPALKGLAVESLKVAGAAVTMSFNDASPLDPAALVALAGSPGRDGRGLRIRPSGVLTMPLEAEDWDERIDEIEELLAKLGQRIGEGGHA